eukprot:9183855-Pyramimonas_sp.AAC.1
MPCTRATLRISSAGWHSCSQITFRAIWPSKELAVHSAMASHSVPSAPHPPSFSTALVIPPLPKLLVTIPFHTGVIFWAPAFRPEEDEEGQENQVPRTSCLNGERAGCSPRLPQSMSAFACRCRTH